MDELKSLIKELREEWTNVIEPWVEVAETDNFNRIIEELETRVNGFS